MRVLVFLVLAACGGHVADLDASAPDDASAKTDAAKPQCELTAVTYGTSCNAAADCAVVFLGNACTAGCVCANGAISQSSLSQYNADLFAATDGAPPTCPCPQGQPPSCCQGQCVSGPCP